MRSVTHATQDKDTYQQVKVMDSLCNVPIRQEGQSRSSHHQHSYAEGGGGAGVVIKQSEQLRIRYLTPRECLRLMGFHETEIDKLMEAVPSKTNLYKLAGNSIVVDCLESIFKAIYIDKTFKNDRKKQKSLDGFLTGINPIVGRSPEEVEELSSKLEGIGQ